MADLKVIGGGKVERQIAQSKAPWLDERQRLELELLAARRAALVAQRDCIDQQIEFLNEVERRRPETAGAWMRHLKQLLD